MGKRLLNPSPLTVAATVVALGIGGTLAYEHFENEKRRKKKSTKKNGTKNGTAPPTTDTTEPKPDDDWGTQMTPSSLALVNGVPMKLFRDGRGRWHFGYSWKHRPEGVGSGPTWDWLRGEKDYDTVIVWTDADNPAVAYEVATKWLDELAGMVTLFAANTNMKPGYITTQVSGYYYGANRDRWGVASRVADKREGFGDRMRFVDDDTEWWYVNHYPGPTSDSGCCYSFLEANSFLSS